MSVLPLVFTSGWAAGVNAYAVVLLLGVMGATGMTDQVPDSLQRTDVLVVAALLYVCEAVADKIPYVDTAWDVVHTVVRPIAGGVVAALLAGQHGSLPQLAAGAIGGATALASHLVKAGARMAVNTSPEPLSTIALSLAEDLVVAAVVVAALFHPLPAAVAAALLLGLGMLAVGFALSRIGRFWRRLRARARRETGRGPDAAGPPTSGPDRTPTSG